MRGGSTEALGKADQWNDGAGETGFPEEQIVSKSLVVPRTCQRPLRMPACALGSSHQPQETMRQTSLPTFSD